jgi:hypothetical protein
MDLKKKKKKKKVLFLVFSPSHRVNIYCSWQQNSVDFLPVFNWDVLHEGLDWQVFSVAQICSQISWLFSSVQSLSIQYRNYPPGNRQDDMDMDPTLWLQLFHSFPSVQSMGISTKLEPSIATGLQGLATELAVKVFPTLHTLTIVSDWPYSAAQQSIQSFVTTCQHSDHPVAVYCLKL